ncbi:MAG: DNA polymerase III subunit delta [Spirosomataceae bacterium]
MSQKINDILKNIKSSSIAPVYVLHGAESYFSDVIAKKVVDTSLSAADKEFNLWTLHGPDVTVGAIVSKCRQFPMMAEKQVVWVKEAQGISDIGQKEATQLLDKYISQATTTTCLILQASKPFDERKSWIKAAQKAGLVFSSKPLYENELPGFILDYCKAKGVGLEAAAVKLVVNHLGTNLKNLTNELDKAIVNLKIGEPITVEVVEQYIGISKEFNYFELQKALTEKDAFKSFQIVEFFSRDSKNYPIQPFVILLYTFFSKLILLHRFPGLNDGELSSKLGVNPYFLKDYKVASKRFDIRSIMHSIGVIRRIDALSKGIEMGSKTEKDLYRELITGVLSA